VRLFLTAFAILALGTVANADPPHSPKTNHPIIGTWTFAMPDSDCEETYYVRQDGTTLVTSGQEVAESVYEIDDEPSPKGFYHEGRQPGDQLHPFPPVRGHADHLQG
jgi:hypothetical protein